MKELLSIVIPFYNERETLPILLARIDALSIDLPREIVLVDDGSTDGTEMAVEHLIDGKQLKLYRHPKNMGKGRAIRTGISKAKGNIIIIQDADMEYNPAEIPRMLQPVIANSANLVFGTRLWHKPSTMSLSHYCFNKALSGFVGWFYGTRVTDVMTGYKAFRVECLEKIEIEATRFEFEPEITTKLLEHGFSPREVKVSYEYRQKGNAKIKFIDGFDAILTVLKVRYFKNSLVFNKLYRFYKHRYVPASDSLTSWIFRWVKRY